MLLRKEDDELLELTVVAFFQCKHQLAARLAASLGACVEVTVPDEELALLLSKL